MQEVFLAAILLARNNVGPYDIFMWQLITRLMGQCKPIIWNEIGLSEGLHTIACRLLWANSGVLAMGRTFIAWAYARGFLGSYSASLK